ncbi:hypothetical protein HMPREF9440_00298 [Sutterella parvirubra YIT 11816]|uniref:Uncharacterized protein n=1 Tax=Sutterella parvirubra YIT 11816 TaxID=762967 RepID=H3KC48_9BURK|nr:hypothetical protein HMPREF9440_00298 [Sutterella parvirubra YIT 11816]
MRLLANRPWGTSPRGFSIPFQRALAQDADLPECGRITLLAGFEKT